jgi:hypothetical protein
MPTSAAVDGRCRCPKRYSGEMSGWTPSWESNDIGKKAEDLAVSTKQFQMKDKNTGKMSLETYEFAKVDYELDGGRSGALPPTDPKQRGPESEAELSYHGFHRFHL